MQIESYRFGSIKINGTVYRKDVIIFPDRVSYPWWRKEGHSLLIDDLKEVIDYKPDTLIIGTGAYGVMRVPDSTVDALKEKKLKIETLKTNEAVLAFNEAMKKKQNVVACLHLTC